MGYNESTIKTIENRHKGKFYNDIEVLSFSRYENTTEIKNTKFKRVSIYNCKCHCGKEFETTIGSLKVDNRKSCGCLNHIYREKPVFRKSENPLLDIIYGRYKYAAKTHERVFELDLQQFEKIIKTNCTYCGIEPSNDASKLRQDRINRGATWIKSYMYNGIDRIDSSKGYTSDNVTSCCFTCNKAKSTMTHEEFITWINRVYKNLNK